MALTDVNGPTAPFDPVPVRPPHHVAGSAGLAALPRLHAEAGENLRLSRFLENSATACVLLMLSGMAALAATSFCGGGSLKADFAWSALQLLGIIAMTRNYIRGFARSLRRVPLQEAAADLRLLLFYSGLAWASGAFLLMPDLPPPALVLGFALLPSLALTLCLKAEAFFFTVPVTTAIAGASLLGAWPLDNMVAAIILAMGVLIVGLPALQHANVKKTQALSH